MAMEDDELNEDIMYHYISKIRNFSLTFIHLYHVQIWISIGIIILVNVLYSRYSEKKRKENSKKQPFKKEIVEKNDENIRLARLKLQEQYREEINSMDIPPIVSKGSVDNKNSNKKTQTQQPYKKSTEGLNPSNNGGRLSFDLRNRYPNT